MNTPVVTWFKTKLISAVIPLLLVLVFIGQNIETVHVRFLFWDLAMPRAVLVLLILIVGIAIGVLFRSVIVGYIDKKLK